MRLLFLGPFHEFFSLFLDWCSRLTFSGVNFTLLRPLDKWILVEGIGDDLILLRSFGGDLIDYGVIIVDINKPFIEI